MLPTRLKYLYPSIGDDNVVSAITMLLAFISLSMAISVVPSGLPITNTCQVPADIGTFGGKHPPEFPLLQVRFIFFCIGVEKFNTT